MFILNLAYRISVTTLISPGSCFNVVVTYEQDNSSFIVTVSRSQYVIEYGGNKKMIINKNDCDTDRLFQLCTVYPFSVGGLQKVIVDSERVYKLLLTL